MAILGFEFDDIARMLALMEASELEEIEWEEPARYIKVSANRTILSQPVQASAQPAQRPATRLSQARRREQKAIAPGAQAGISEDQIPLVSPMVGVFYRSGKPGDPPLVEVGQMVQQDQAIGIIEAMKIFSEIPAEHSGVVVAVPAQDGQLVEAGTPLVILRKSA